MQYSEQPTMSSSCLEEEFFTALLLLNLLYYFQLLYNLHTKQVQGEGHERGREFMPSSQIFWRSLWQFHAWNRIQSYIGNMSQGPAAEIEHRKKLVKE